MAMSSTKPRSNVPELTVAQVGQVDYAEFFTIIEHHRYDDRLSLYSIELHYFSMDDEETHIATFGLHDLRCTYRLFEAALTKIREHQRSRPKTEAEKEAEKLLRDQLGRAEASSAG